ncbi:hypothetical protein Xsto_02891 [Xenorhabdus stockiae]|uniref:Uncharacterized protein n=1 Tax=Xenorhabdus stockiae TaxID=351614 RepID=A0A2D0KM40_9GAMM|nr:hypothetical protein Xsto_02891 [Xenorhabdus stockiae]
MQNICRTQLNAIKKFEYFNMLLMRTEVSQFREEI